MTGTIPLTFTPSEKSKDKNKKIKKRENISAFKPICSLSATVQEIPESKYNFNSIMVLLILTLLYVYIKLVIRDFDAISVK